MYDRSIQIVRRRALRRLPEIPSYVAIVSTVEIRCGPCLALLLIRRSVRWSFRPLHSNTIAVTTVAVVPKRDNFRGTNIRTVYPGTNSSLPLRLRDRN